MFERFTDRARKAMVLASQEAQRFNHEYIGTEHILLGLVKEGSGLAATVLKNLDVDLRNVRIEVKTLTKPHPKVVAAGKLPQTSGATRVIEYANEEARILRHNYIGTEHLLLGLLREKDGFAIQILLSLRLNPDRIREEVLNLLSAGLEEVFMPETVEAELRPLYDEIQRLEVVKDELVKEAEYERAAEARDEVQKLREQFNEKRKQLRRGKPEGSS